MTDPHYSASLEPVAAGSGIPQVKCYLNGVKVLFSLILNLMLNIILYRSSFKCS